MNVFLTEPAEKFLQEIFHFYKLNASDKVAHKLLNGIFDRIDSLENFAKRGKVEPYLKSLGQGHRFVLEGNFKIIYLIESDAVYITDVFDTRQNPKKLLKRK